MKITIKDDEKDFNSIVIYINMIPIMVKEVVFDDKRPEIFD